MSPNLLHPDEVERNRCQDEGETCLDILNEKTSWMPNTSIGALDNATSKLLSPSPATTTNSDDALRTDSGSKSASWPTSIGTLSFGFPLESKTDGDCKLVGA